jgi:hypothetical protein
MTYIKEKIYKKSQANLNVYYNATATMGNDEPVTWANLDSSFSNNFSLTKSGAQFTIPNDSKTYVLNACLTSNSGTSNSHAIYQWYDVTNSQYVGTKGKISGAYNMNEGRSGTVVANESAMFVTNQNNTYELRIISHASITNIDESNTGNYAGRARCCIWRF